MQLEERLSLEEILSGPSLCPLCGTPTNENDLAEASWLSPVAVAVLEERHPLWELAHGACPACVQRVMCEVLLTKGEQKLEEAFFTELSVARELAFGVLPTHMRLHVDERYQGRGVTLALVDSGFYPHPDLTTPRNRIRAWVNATTDPVSALFFDEDDQPEWPGWNSASGSQWHGTMTSVVAAGNGYLSHGLYRGLAPEAQVVLVQARGKDGCISNETITRALRWLEEHGPELGVRIVSLSVAGEPVRWLAGNPVDESIAALVKQGVTVVSAAGNAGTRDLVPPATSPDALTVGGLDDHNNFDPEEIDLWHSNYGKTVTGRMKPELVAPSIWVAAPVLPGSTVDEDARELFARRHLREPETESRIAAHKLITPHYQHVDGTSFAAPIVSSVVACLLEANLDLTPQQIRRILTSTAQPIAGVALERQGAGALNSTLALAAAVRVEGAPLAGYHLSPQVSPYGVTFYLYDRHTHSVHVQGSWDDWEGPGVEAQQILPNIWRAHIDNLQPGRYTYRFLLGGVYWLADPDNPVRSPNKYCGFDSVLDIPEQPAAPNLVVAKAQSTKPSGRKGRTKKAKA
ncbi:MAG: S8 family serine peptidase [Chloroflexota bacterium]|nr:S8 family serine peptidase [Chloroflexota bacterium]